MMTSARPPKPSALPPRNPSVTSIRSSLKASTTMDGSANGQMDMSENSRKNLRREMNLRRAVLTPQEHGFLEHLCIHGDEIEVELARTKLMDTDLFFEDLTEEADKNDDLDSEAQESEWDNRSKLDEEEEFEIQRFAAATACIGAQATPSTQVIKAAMNIGSEKRKQQLDQRRQSQVKGLHGKIWKAHASGLALSAAGSRRSIGIRDIVKTAMANNNFRRQQDVFRGGQALVDDISESNHTERSASERSIRGEAMDDVRSDSNHTTSSRRLYQRPRIPLRRLQSDGGRPQAMPAPTHHRRQSSSSRRVSFKEPAVPRPGQAQRVFSEGSARAQSETSQSTFPSLHLGHPIASPSQSFGSIPAIGMARPVRSQSFRSVASSITSAQDEDRDPSESDEKKTSEGWVDKADAIPSSVEIHKDSADVSKPHGQLLVPSQSLLKPVLIRGASTTTNDGEQGIEVADLMTEMPAYGHSVDSPNHERFRRFSSFGDMSGATSIRSCSSFDETMSYARVTSIFRKPIQRSLSNEGFNSFFGVSKSIDFIERETRSSRVDDDDDESWQLNDDGDLDYYDSWKVIEDESINGYGGGGTLSFYILGTSASDESACPHVLSPPLMESLQNFLPYSKSGENFYMKYSMVRDGASLITFLQYARGTKYSLIAIETVDGEVFGAFCGEGWRKNWNYFGTGEAFLWRMRHNRLTKCHSVIDQAHMESEIDVYPFTRRNHNVQLCTHEKIAVGGGEGGPYDEPISKYPFGFGLTIDQDFLHGTSSPCLTFGSPSLSTKHPDGSPFEIMNMELWTLTPCTTEAEAQKLELGKLFLEEHGRLVQ